MAYRDPRLMQGIAGDIPDDIEIVGDDTPMSQEEYDTVRPSSGTFRVGAGTMVSPTYLRRLTEAGLAGGHEQVAPAPVPAPEAPKIPTGGQVPMPGGNTMLGTLIDAEKALAAREREKDLKLPRLIGETVGRIVSAIAGGYGAAAGGAGAGGIAAGAMQGAFGGGGGGGGGGGVNVGQIMQLMQQFRSMQGGQ